MSAELNELDLIKLKLSSETELKGVTEGNKGLYSERIEDRLSCKVCNFYDVPDAGDVLDSRPFKCQHFFNPLCVTAWKVHGLNITKSKGHLNQCFVCKSGIWYKYTDVYEHDWNLNEIETKSLINKRHIMF